MPSREIVARELAEIFKIIAHPDRIRIIEELGTSEMDVNGLAEVLGLPSTRISQHLALMRAHRMVEERREGRHHFYHLAHPDMAEWDYRCDPLCGNSPIRFYEYCNQGSQGTLAVR